MKKRLLSLLLSAALLCGALPTAFAATKISHPRPPIPTGGFSDVSSSDWFYENVRASYEYDLINGYNDGKFHPDDDLTIAQAVKLAACLNSLYSSGTADFSAASPWYQPYVDYARRNGILTRTFADYNAPASPAVNLRPCWPGRSRAARSSRSTASRTARSRMFPPRQRTRTRSISSTVPVC